MEKLIITQNRKEYRDIYNNFFSITNILQRFTFKWFFISLKRRIEHLFAYPLLIVGKIVALFNPLKEEYDIFIFMSDYCTDDLIKLNQYIIGILKDKQVIIFQTRKTKSRTLFSLQKDNVTVKEIHFWTDNILFIWGSRIYRGICAHYINEQINPPIVFSEQCNFAYKLLPHLKKSIKKVDFIQDYNPSTTARSLPYVPFIDTRIMTSNGIVKFCLEKYRHTGIPKCYDTQIACIQKPCQIPNNYPQRPKSDQLKVYCESWGDDEERINLIFCVTRICLSILDKIEFHYAGSFKSKIPKDISAKIHWHEISNPQKKTYELYQQMDVFLFTALSKNMPTIIMEAMSSGMVIVATATGLVPEYISDEENGFLIKNENESTLVMEAVNYLRKLNENRSVVTEMSMKNFIYAKENFSLDSFSQNYQTVLGV